MRILHFSDTHLGAETHGRKDPETGMHTQLKDLLRCLDFVVETAVNEDVDAVLFTGDAYHSWRPDPLPQREFIKRIISLSERNIAVLILAGNHDLPPAKDEASALDIFSVVKIPGVVFTRQPKVISLPTRKGELQVFCLPYLPRRSLISFEEERALDEDKVQQLMGRRVQEGLESLLQKSNQSDSPAILVGHIWVQGAEFSGSERILTSSAEPIVPPSVLRHRRFAYVGLGHIHRHQAIDDFSPPIVYAGSLGRLNFGEEKQPKGFVIVDLERTREGRWEANWRFVQTPTRLFLTIKLDVRNSVNPSQTAIELLNANPQIDGAVVRVHILVKEAQRDQINLSKLREILEKRADRVALIEMLSLIHISEPTR
ncbi:MAG: exonuclease SbcCD subunit D, partial [Armatimonadetes bacterium]|nr:exonuclease SbcCD subunit D [Armatimonadota bacterium]